MYTCTTLASIRLDFCGVLGSLPLARTICTLRDHAWHIQQCVRLVLCPHLSSLLCCRSHTLSTLPRVALRILKVCRLVALTIFIVSVRFLEFRCTCTHYPVVLANSTGPRRWAPIQHGHFVDAHNLHWKSDHSANYALRYYHENFGCLLLILARFAFGWQPLWCRSRLLRLFLCLLWPIWLVR